MPTDVEEIVERIKKEKDVFSKAKLIRHLLREKNIKGADLAYSLGINPSYVCHFDRLNNLPEIIVDGYYSGLVTVSHLFLISRIKDQKKLTEVYTKVLSNNLTIRDTEELIRDAIYGIETNGNYIKDNDKEKLRKDLLKTFPETDVKILQTKIKGKIIIETTGSLDKTSRIIRELVKKLSN